MLPNLSKLSVADRLKLPTSIKVVVLCHGRPFAGHWQELVIRKRTQELFADRIADGEVLDFFTLDPNPDRSNPADFPHGGAQDLFSSTKFSRTPRFHMIWAPDCGGEWQKMMEMKGDEQRKQLVDLALTMRQSLVPDGFMMLGKLPFEYSKLTEVADALRKAGFARAEVAPVPDPYGAETPLAYILLQK